jgi:excisionase family DNA binding protein
MAKSRKSAFHSASSQVPRLLSVQQAAGKLGISRTLTYELMSAGQLRSVKVKRRRSIPRESIEQFIAQQRRYAASALEERRLTVRSGRACARE